MRQNLMEGLEPRTLMAAFAVTSTADSGAGSLRQAIESANALAGADTITFAQALNGSTITLGGTQLSITGDLSIDGPGANLLAVSGNHASRVFSVGIGATVFVSGLTITGGGNTSNGAGISNNGTLTVTNCTFSGNSAATEGGGIFNHTTLTVTGSTFSGNSAVNGAAIENQGTATITNSTITANTASILGGGIHSFGTTMTVRNSTIAGNLGGGGLESDFGGPTVINTIISANAGGDVVGSPLAAGSINNLIQDSAHAGGLFNGVNGNLVGADPLLGALAFKGGPTQTMPLLAGSPAIDKGSSPGLLTTDQRGNGFSRVVGLAADIGAFEFGNPPVVTAADTFIATYNAAPKSANGLVDGDWIAATLNATVPNVVTSDAYWGATNYWFQNSLGDLWALWNGGTVHNSQTLPGQHEWVLVNLTDAAGLSGTMHLAQGSLSGITTGWNAFSVQGIQDGTLRALWWSPEGSAGTYIDTDGTLKQGKGWGNRGNGWILSSITEATTTIGGALVTTPVTFLPFTESQGNGRTEFDPRPSRFITNRGISVVTVDANHNVYVTTFSTSQRAIAGARPDLNNVWVLEPLAEVPSIADFGLSGQVDAIELGYVNAAVNQ